MQNVDLTAKHYFEIKQSLIDSQIRTKESGYLATSLFVQAALDVLALEMDEHRRRPLTQDI